jgi:hypothetical protein
MKTDTVAYLATDAGMMVLLIVQMAYLATGQQWHEWQGIIFLLLIGVHLVIGRHWFLYLTKGRYPPRRIFQTVLNLTLLVALISVAVSGVMMSTHAVPFLRSPQHLFIARTMHLAVTHWWFILAGVHIGANWHFVTGRVRQATGVRLASPFSRNAMRAVLAFGGIYGLISFIDQGVLDYMLLRVPYVNFDHQRTLWLFISSQLAIVIFGAILGFLADRAILRGGVFVHHLPAGYVQQSTRGGVVCPGRCRRRRSPSRPGS